MAVEPRFEGVSAGTDVTDEEIMILLYEFEGDSGLPGAAEEAALRVKALNEGFGL